ncbi:MAG: Nif3-like dinuclear metal center hexameric protein [Spirochaetales bacterium]|nr:Nif3-like dinuclear metal center hexameric protein [Spirochaetales bacterium]
MIVADTLADPCFFGYNAPMNIDDFDKWCRSYLEIDAMERADASMNGVQIGNSGGEIKKIAFAVDACLDTLKKASDVGADVLFVHHGLFWGRPVSISGDHYKRVKTAMDGDLVLYACHLPLDMHPEYGNNAGLAAVLGLTDVEGFGEYKGFNIGVKGRFEKPVSRDDIIPALFSDWEAGVRMLPFGPAEIKTVGIISGGGTREVSDAIAEGLDLYITGDASHQVYHESLEAGINVLFGGHYMTEITGVQSVMKKCSEELKLETVFIDVPTGL